MNLSKQQLRKQLIAERAAIAPDYARQAAKLLRQHVASLVGDVQGVVVACYMPYRGEINSIPVAEMIHENGGIIAMPRVDKTTNHMIFKEWAPGDRTELNDYGIHEPFTAARSLSPTLLLLPLVGFDAAGYRLGYGGGYYDRALAQLRTMPTPVHAVGLGYAMQEVASLPYEAHDARLNALVTEHGSRVFG